MKRFSDRHQLTTLSELNVTPLLDLAFVLLIIFMITTPLMENSSSLVLPTNKAAEGAADPAQLETISIDKDALVTLDNAPVTLDALEPARRQTIRDEIQTAFQFGFMTAASFTVLCLVLAWINPQRRV